MKQIELTQKKHALVDDEDFQMLSQFKWAFNKGYGFRRKRAHEGKGHYLMHRFIMKMHKIEAEFIDHIDGNGLNNQKANLRPCSRSQNMANQKIRTSSITGFKGVHFNKRDLVFTAFIRLNRKLKYLGSFKDAQDAAAAYNAAAIENFGEFAKLNKI